MKIAIMTCLPAKRVYEYKYLPFTSLIQMRLPEVNLFAKGNMYIYARQPICDLFCKVMIEQRAG